jgi:hypothetical protein
MHDPGPPVLCTTETGIQIADLETDPGFAARQLHARHIATPIEGVNRLARALVQAPETILQELVQAAVDLCGADSAGISMETDNGTEDKYYEWVATAGEYSKFLHALLPRFPSACGTCLERDRPQLFRISKCFFDRMGVKAAEVTDGMLLPWKVNGKRGTIWILAHGRTEAFDQDDLRIMQVLANITAMGVRQQALQLVLTKQTRAAGANDLAKRLHRSLDDLRNILYLAEWSQTGEEAKTLAEEMTGHLRKLATLAGRFLKSPDTASRPN